MNRPQRLPRAPFVAPEPGTVVGNVQAWGRAWSATETRWRPVRLEEGQRCNGFAMRYRRLFVAAYASGERIWLQVGRRAWDTALLTRVVQRHEQVRSASYDLVFSDGRMERVRLRMPEAVVASRLLDPTYDEIDSLADDLLKLFPYEARDGWRSTDADVQDWVARARPLWQAGVTHGP